MADGDASNGQRCYAAVCRRARGCSSGSALLWVWVTALSCLLPLPAGRALLSHDGQILLSFANQTKSSTSYMGSWNEGDSDPCGWMGVLCGSDSAVDRLDFSSWSLQDHVNLSTLSSLGSLRELDISSNTDAQFDGLGTLSGLTSLNLSDTKWRNTLPNVTSANLRYLYADRESSRSGRPHKPHPLDSHWQQLGRDLDCTTQATILVLRLEGPLALPRTAVSVPELQFLDMSWNGLNGSIPEGFTDLKYLDLSNNHLSGAIPPDIGKNAGIAGDLLDLSGNKLGGSIPEGLLQRYQRVNLSRNSLDGNIPDDLCKGVDCVRGCNSLDLSDNKMEGHLPSSLPNFLSYYGSLWLQNNNLSGDITYLLPQMPQLSSIRLQGNLFTGDLTPFFTSISATVIGELDLSYNRFNMTHTTANPNPLQALFDNQASLQLISPFRALRLAGANLLALPLPKLSAPSSLEVLDLASCNLSGSIPGLMCSSFPNLTTFNVSDNNLSGSIPEDLPSSLQVLDIGNNMLGMSNMPRILFQTLPNLLQLHASNNSLQGPIPEALPRARLQVLDLSHNTLQGSIPDRLFFALAQLRDFDFSNNKLSGPIPPGLNNSLGNASRFANNPELCGAPLGPCSTANRVIATLQMLSTVLVGVVLLSSAFCMLSAYQWRKQHQQDKDLIATLLERESVILMSLRQLRTATGNFSRSSQIGVGGFGVVYAGQLRDGTAVAIKKSKRMSSSLDKQQFLNEVRILSQVNHRHLVRLLGCCLENKIALLVFEYVPNGTLQEHLQGKRGDVRSRLTWRQRLHIALQTSEALDYLHSAAQHPIFHRDVKSANILLDQELNAKVVDFGVSKLVPKWATHVSTLAIQGTLGYIDPEYYTSFQLTSKSDVYSFGAVLLELISGKSPMNLLSIWEEASLVDLAVSVKKKGDWGEFIDPVLLDTLDSPAGRTSMESIACLAAKCLALRSRERPDMKEVRQQLQTLVYKHCDPCFDQLSN